MYYSSSEPPKHTPRSPFTPVTWNVIGLDSNNVTVGPNSFLVGVRVCNTGATTVNNIVGTLVWDSANGFISVGGPNPSAAQSLAPGACTNVFFNVIITRTTAAYNQTRRYHITVTADGEPNYSTPTPREIYVEKLVSQNRNSTQSVTGPTSVVVGQTYTYVVNGKTATGGYDQLESFLNFPTSMFYTNVATTGGTNNAELTAYNLVITEDGNVSGNNWGSTTDHLIGATDTQGGTITGDIAGSSVLTDTVSPLGPGEFGVFTFKRAIL